MELNHLVQDQSPGQVTPRLASRNLVEHLPNVPSYRPPITRIPVLISRRTNLSTHSPFLPFFQGHYTLLPGMA